MNPALSVQETKMKNRLSGWDRFFRFLTLLAAVLYAVAVYDVMAHNFLSRNTVWETVFDAFLLTPSMLLISALIIWRLPGNLVGRFLLLVGLGGIGWMLTYDYPSLELRSWLVVTQFVYWLGLAFPSLIYVMYVFPSGKVYPPRWATALFALAALKFAGVALEYASMPTEQFAETVGVATENRIFLPALQPYSGLLQYTIGSYGLLLIVFILGGVISIVGRYRAASGVERQQIKWVAWSLSLLAASVAGLAVVTSLSPNTGVGWDRAGWLVMISILIMIASIGLAVLRYRLWDIDILINRTLVYGALTAILALVYFASVVGLQQVFQTLTGQAGSSPAAVVISTLAIAALFTPLRRRIQAGIDRRFYRRRYDAERVLQVFAETTRNEVDLEQLHMLLVSVVQETMQPESVSLWLKKTGNQAHRSEP
jgi:hypothetical protein